MITIAGLGAIIYVSNFTDMFMLTVALCAYKKVSEYETFLKNLPKWSLSEKRWLQRDFSCLVNTAKKMKQFFKQLNAVISGLSLAWFLTIIPFFSYKFMDSFPGQLIGKMSLPLIATHTVYYWTNISLHVFILLLLAETRRKVDKQTSLRTALSWLF